MGREGGEVRREGGHCARYSTRLAGEEETGEGKGLGGREERMVGAGGGVGMWGGEGGVPCRCVVQSLHPVFHLVHVQLVVMVALKIVVLMMMVAMIFHIMATIMMAMNISVRIMPEVILLSSRIWNVSTLGRFFLPPILSPIFCARFLH